MPQKYKVFFNHNTLNFVKSYFIVPRGCTAISNPTKEQLRNLVNTYIESDTRDQIYILCSDVKASWKLFTSIFKKKKAAGGLVVNENRQWLLIKRKGLWDLPKGHIEKGEKTRQAALREVEEECGINQLTIDYKINKTYHTYKIKQSLILKPTTWYLMEYKGNKMPTPQTKEGISKAIWVDADELERYCKKAFPSIKSVIKMATGFDAALLTEAN
jgi:8-oxo-dGTP pyrophosphatase MutT (NUDIX family)